MPTSSHNWLFSMISLYKSLIYSQHSIKNNSQGEPRKTQAAWVEANKSLPKDIFFGHASTVKPLPDLPKGLLFESTRWTENRSAGSHFEQEPISRMKEPTEYPIRNHCMVAALRTLLSICGLPDDHLWIDAGSANTTALREALDRSGLPELFHVNPFGGDGMEAKGLSLDAIRYLLAEEGCSTRLLPTGASYYKWDLNDCKRIYQILQANGYDISEDLNNLLKDGTGAVKSRLRAEMNRMSQQTIRALRNGYPVLVLQQHVTILYQPPGSNEVLISDAFKRGWERFESQSDENIREFISRPPNEGFAQVLILTDRPEKT